MLQDYESSRSISHWARGPSLFLGRNNSLRSAGVRPPKIPVSISSAIANERHWLRTGHVAQIALALTTLLRSSEKKISVSCVSHAASNCHMVTPVLV